MQHGYLTHALLSRLHLKKIKRQPSDDLMAIKDSLKVRTRMPACMPVSKYPTLTYSLLSPGLPVISEVYATDVL